MSVRKIDEKDQVCVNMTWFDDRGGRLASVMVPAIKVEHLTALVSGFHSDRAVRVTLDITLETVYSARTEGG